MKNCVHCGSNKIYKFGIIKNEQQYHCDDCKRAFTKNTNPNRNLIVNDEKFCTRCESFKPLSEYHYYKNKPRSKCKECFNSDNNSRFRRYNMNIDFFNEMLIYQDNKCSICKNNFKTNKHAFIDHDHITGNVRELLCPKCNALLGSCNDNIKILISAVSYLKKHHKTGNYREQLPVL